MSEIKLLPCPFCGGEEIHLVGITVYHATFWDVHCYNCHLRVSGVENKELAIKRWNTRKPMERIIERLEVKKLDQLSAKAEYISDMNGQSQCFCEGYIKAIEEEIEIVKEEGGIHEEN